MITLLTMAWGATPDELREALPDAKAQLEVCETTLQKDRCARAAWLVALGTYVDTGVADGQLAHTVQVLDPQLFSDLPQVVREAPGSPLPWAVLDSAQGDDRDVTTDLDELPKSEWMPSTPQRIAHDAFVDPKPGSLKVKVVDAEGNPIPALIRILGEGLRHTTHVETGTWVGTSLYRMDRRVLGKGETVDLEVWSPQHAIQRHRVVMDRRNTQIDVTLDAPHVIPSSNVVQAEPALRMFEAWVKAATTHARMPSAWTENELEKAERIAVETLRAWYDAEPTDAVRDLCLSVGHYWSCGARPPLPDYERHASVDRADIEAFVADAVRMRCRSTWPGWVIVPVRVDTNGTVTPAGEPTDTFDSTALAECVTNELVSTRFPTPPDMPVEFDVPVLLPRN